MNRTSALRTLSLSLLLTASAIAVPAHAQISFSVNLAPPAPQYEIVPAIQPGHVWAPGYWGWSGERHVWVRGRTITQREGYRWEPDRWEQRNQAYHHRVGYWERDRGNKPGKVKKQKKQNGHGHEG